MPLPAGVADKIRSHKFGRRKLATDSAWTGYNRRAKNENGKHTAFLQRVAANALVQQYVGLMNAALVAALGAFGLDGIQPSLVKIAFPDEMFIPRAVWYGYLRIATGSLTEAQRTTFETAEKSYADNAGKLRSQIARIMAVEALENDIANADESPNPGGVVGAA